MDRAKFEELIAGHLADIEKVMVDVMTASKLKPDEIYSVEIVGGSTRIPAIKAIIERVFGKECSTTLNADEAVSRGCALQCAILSPVFKVREFSVTDIQPYPVKLVWAQDTSGEGQPATGEMEVFPQNHPVPFSKMLTFYKTSTFQVTGEYVHDTPYPERHIGIFEIGDVRPTAEGGSQKVKVKVRINPNGIFGVSSANLVEKHEIEEEVPEDAMETDEKKDEADKKDEKNAAEKAPEAAEAKPEDQMETGEAAAKPEEKKEVKMVKRKKVVNKNIDLPISQKV